MLGEGPLNLPDSLAKAQLEGQAPITRLEGPEKAQESCLDDSGRRTDSRSGGKFAFLELSQD